VGGLGVAAAAASPTTTLATLARATARGGAAADAGREGAALGSRGVAEWPLSPPAGFGRARARARARGLAGAGEEAGAAPSEAGMGESAMLLALRA
jgi:hypothetical protein